VLLSFWNFSALLNGLRLQSYLSEDSTLTNLGEEVCCHEIDLEIDSSVSWLSALP
jgi:hypothetical protein